jgi:flagella basal body P-ring formation protein FlgA
MMESRLAPSSALSVGHAIADSVLHGSTAPDPPEPLLIRAGDRVRLWSAGANVRLEIEAIALEYGRTGQVIHLRRLGNDASQKAILTGVVDGVGSAELLP